MLRFILFSALLTFSVRADPASDELRALREQIAAQQTQIDQLRKVLDEQSRLLDKLAGAPPTAPQAEAAPRSAPLLDQVARQSETTAHTLGGFQFSGDFRYRLDLQARSANDAAGPLQNIRGRYRVRLNVDKELDPRLKFHVQLSTGPYNVQTTNDQDMGAFGAKAPFSVAEAYVDFHPHKNFAMRGGRMEEVFADNSRFLWDDDIRFNGFQQTLRVPLAANSLKLTSVEFRAGEYILSNPAVYVMSAASPYAASGYRAGAKVRDANLFHPGVIVKGDLSGGWTQQIIGDMQLYRNPNQIQLASTANGYPVLVSNGLGLTLSAPLPATGNATTTAGGAIYSASDFHIARVAYRLERKGVQVGGKEMPFYLDFQGSGNLGTSRARYAYMGSANLGAIKAAGDVRILYQYVVKNANSLISQFTDDDLGTGSGVNIAVHAFRVDVGLTRFLQWQNLLFVQHQRNRSDPAGQFFVPLQQGSNATFRYLGQLAFSF